jgi:hypothetical protein
MLQHILQCSKMENTTVCPKDEAIAFVDGVKGLLWRSNALMVVNALLVASMVVISASGWRYRRSTVTRFLSLGASTLFLPIASYVVSSIGSEYCQAAGMNVDCYDEKYVFLLLMWTVLVQTVGINFSAIVAVNDGGAQKLGPSIDLLAKMLWISYLVFYYYSRGYHTGPKRSFWEQYPSLNIESLALLSTSLIALCVLGMVKISLKFYAFEKARRSFALGRNAHLVAGYMEQLSGRPSDDEPIPPLIVMGEEKQQIEERPHGYIINCEMTDNSFVTLDRIWRMASTGDVLLEHRPQLKDLCLSFSLFKLLRRRFARCQLAESGCTKPFKFIQNVLLNNGGPDRVFRVIADEVSFLGDSYYSSNPASNFGKLLPILNIIVSLSVILSLILALSICLITSHLSFGNRGIIEPFGSQMRCKLLSCHVLRWANSYTDSIYFGSQFFNSVPTLFLLVAAILAEAWEIASYVCSNWVKVALICSYVTHASWQQSPCVHRWLGLALRFRIKFIKSCSDQMGQVSLLPRRPAAKNMLCQTGLLRVLWQDPACPSADRGEGSSSPRARK